MLIFAHLALPEASDSYAEGNTEAETGHDRCAGTQRGEDNVCYFPSFVGLSCCAGVQSGPHVLFTL